MIMTVFRNRLDPEQMADYEKTAVRIEALARTMPGFKAIKTFRADDGERVSIVEFDSWDTMNQWRTNEEHQKAQQEGREKFYTEFSTKSFEY